MAQAPIQTSIQTRSKSRILLASLAASSLMLTSACVTDPNTGQQKISRTALGTGGGAVIGLLLGGLIGGGTGRIIGAGIGGIAGGAVGYTMDKQIKQLKEKTEGTGVDVTTTDNGKAILVNLPDGVTFDVAAYDLKPQFRTTLDQIAASMTQYPNSLIDVYGHTDSTGSDSYNQTLSENRARTVANYLEMHGVAGARIRSQGYGKTLPIADNTTPEGRAKNRRVEIKIVPISQEQVQAAKTAGS